MLSPATSCHLLLASGPLSNRGIWPGTCRGGSVPERLAATQNGSPVWITQHSFDERDRIGAPTAPNAVLPDFFGHEYNNSG
jgi:hypothetical protein